MKNIPNHISNSYHLLQEQWRNGARARISLDSNQLQEIVALIAPAAFLESLDATPRRQLLTVLSALDRPLVPLYNVCKNWPQSMAFTLSPEECMLMLELFQRQVLAVAKRDGQRLHVPLVAALLSKLLQDRDWELRAWALEWWDLERPLLLAPMTFPMAALDYLKPRKRQLQRRFKALALVR